MILKVQIQTARKTSRIEAFVRYASIFRAFLNANYLKVIRQHFSGTHFPTIFFFVRENKN